MAKKTKIPKSKGKKSKGKKSKASKRTQPGCWRSDRLSGHPSNPDYINGDYTAARFGSFTLTSYRVLLFPLADLYRCHNRWADRNCDAELGAEPVLA
jgi:hypothetical protein